MLPWIKYSVLRKKEKNWIKIDWKIDRKNHTETDKHWFYDQRFNQSLKNWLKFAVKVDFFENDRFLLDLFGVSIIFSKID